VNQRRQIEHGRFFNTAAPTIAGRRAAAHCDQHRVISAKLTGVIFRERCRTRIVVSESRDMAWEIGAFRVTSADGGERRGKHLVPWQKRDGAWKVVAECSTTSLL
jgi:ketosteroid isomerase-like protein